uniref:Uncharacterized protein n=1 Tax=Brassica campestris TaxID=3711 RepID=A0A3P6ADR8_BRACM|nr:unnamed protein product [Brassica rapa]
MLVKNVYPLMLYVASTKPFHQELNAVQSILLMIVPCAWSLGVHVDTLRFQADSFAIVTVVGSIPIYVIISFGDSELFFGDQRSAYFW